MGVFSAFDVSASGMTAQRTRLDVISQNIANVNSTRDADGNVYKRKTVVFQEKAYYSWFMTHPILMRTRMVMLHTQMLIQ